MSAIPSFFHHSALVKRLHPNQHSIPHQYPQTPQSILLTPHRTRMIDDGVKIVLHKTYPDLLTVEQVALDFAMMKQNSHLSPLLNGSPHLFAILPIYLIPIASSLLRTIYSPHPLALDELRG
jgi:hypothetical protein